MSEIFSPSSIGINLFWLVVGSLVILPLVIAFVLSFKAPYLALRLIRRNRPLGRNIYCELAQADRFMEVWMLGGWSSAEAQYHYAFVTNGNGAAAKISSIDAELVKLNLLESYVRIDNNNAPMVRPKDGKYYFRNYIVFFLLLFLRVAIFGDQYSHIKIDSHYSEKKLKISYLSTASALFIVFCVFILLILYLLRYAY